MTTQIEADVFDRVRLAEEGCKPQPQTRVLDAIFTKAVWRDRVCSIYRENLEARIGFHGRETDRDLDDGELTAYTVAVIELCATIAPAALRRLSDPLNGVIARRLDEDMDEDEIAAFLRPIFEESGIGARYVSEGDAAIRARGNL